ncbi:MAG: methylated-DNA--[protein]-cysteine S-methyltransferase [Armatimonadota bacterium]
MKYCSTIETSYGWVGVVMNDNRISRLILPDKDKTHLEATLKNIEPDAPLESGQLSKSVIDQISNYFTGTVLDFNLQVDYTDATTFEQKVWEAARKIPYGTTVSYTDLAQTIGNPNACRAVGNALGRNPVPVVVPCHRILRSDGTLGGFSAGLSWKEVLLNIERKNKTVNGGKI